MAKGKAEFKKLFTPGKIGQMEVRNRIVMPPMGTSFAAEDGSVSQRIKDYYEARARGGSGLIIVECTCVEGTRGATSVLGHELLIDDDRFMPGLIELAQVIHKHGAKAALQLHHAGRDARPIRPDLQPVGPSATVARKGDKPPHELTKEEIKQIVDLFVAGAIRAKKAGFDGVEIHGAHFYLLNQFLSAASNKRTDEYGGSFENRARFFLETIKAVREAVGKDYPVWCRINGCEFGMKDGITLEDAKKNARMAQEAGCDAIHVSGWGQYARGITSMGFPVGFLSYLAAGIKKAVTVPVIAVGRITPEFGEHLLQRGKADFIAIGRALICDPDLPRKTESEQLEDVVPCLSCDNCRESIRGYRSPTRLLRCALNVAMGEERASEIRPAKKARNVVVIGGGPAGLETARVAALRGHQVTLFEKENSLGGQLHVASIPPDKQDIQRLTAYLARQVQKLGVKVKLGKAVDAAQIKKLNPDVVVVATGSNPTVPEIPGIDKSNVVSANDVLLGRVPVGVKVVIIGGELVGCETADFLAERGKKVTLVRRGPQMAAKMSPLPRFQLLERLTTKGVTMLTGVKYEKITDKGLIISTSDGKEQLLEADTIVVAAGAKSSSELYPVLKAQGYETYLVGDSIEPRGIFEAIHEGSATGRAI